MRKSDYTPVVFLFYVLLLGFVLMHHELWGDEVHTWNLAKGSATYADLIANRRYEGHPPGWHSLLWVITRFTHNVAFMQAAQWLIACGVVFFILFYSPFPRTSRALLPFGYYFLFEYGVLSRNYALGVLFACCICMIIRKEFRYKNILYYLFLFCLSNVHLLGLLLAGSFHVYFLLLRHEQKKTVWPHLLTGLLIALPAVYFIFPPSDGELNMHVLASLWTPNQLAGLCEVPLRALAPIPAWWNEHFWNTEFLIDAGTPKWGMALLAAALLCGVFFILRGSRKSTALFAINLLLSFAVSLTLFSLGTARYAGFVYIGFITACWIGLYERPLGRGQIRLLNAFLLVQIAGGVFAAYKDVRLPFSNMYQVSALLKEVPPGEPWVTDYWTMNAIEAYTDQPAYCIDVHKNLSFVLWDGTMAALQKTSNRYSAGLVLLFKTDTIRSVYMITQSTLPMLLERDPGLSAAYRITLIDKREGAIEKGSNLYLYRISGP